MDLSKYGMTEEVDRDDIKEDRGELELFERIYGQLVERRERILSGQINCIPWGLPRFEQEVPGIEQGKFYAVTANQKVGKSQLTDYLFVYNPIKYAIDNPGKIKLKIFYVTLEMSVEQKYQQYICHLLYTLTNGEIRISPKDLRSTSSKNPLDSNILKLLKEDKYIKYYKYLENTVTFIDSIRNPFGIYDMMREYAKRNGIQHKKIIEIEDKSTKEKKLVEVDDYYEPYDPDEYVVLIVDHLSLLSTENNTSLRDSIIKFTSDYCVKLRNKYKYIIVVVQQQAQAQEGIENLKANKIRPTADGLGEAKITSRDFDYLYGLFSPARHNLPTYQGYDITKFKDNIRFLEIIAGREGGGGSLYPLYFDGAVNLFKELPLPNNEKELNEVYKLIRKIRE